MYEGSSKSACQREKAMMKVKKGKMAEEILKEDGKRGSGGGGGIRRVWPGRSS